MSNVSPGNKPINDKTARRLALWIRLLAVIFRLLIITGLLLLLLLGGVHLFTSMVAAWILIFPIIIIITGIFLAWMEYRLDGRRYQLHYSAEVTKQDRPNESNGG